MYLTFAPTRTLNFNLSRFYPVDLAIRYIAMADCKKDCSSNDGADKSEQFTVVYIHCAELMKESDKNPRVCGRVRSKDLFMNIIMFLIKICHLTDYKVSMLQCV